jgi:4-amino-4-deoxy-L-arabinose transferase-like glycosyltransferase
MASAFAIGAVVLLVGRFKFPIIPLIAPVACGCASIAFFSLPTILDRYSREIAIVGAIVLVWTIYETWHQRRLHKADPGDSVGLTKWLRTRAKEQ